MAPLNIPKSNATVRVRAIDTKFFASLHSDRFLEPVTPGMETLNLTTVCYLLENRDSSGQSKRILFDCGARKDFENYPPAIKARLNSIIKGLKIEADVNDVLEDAGIELKSLDAIVWSHWHWDHNGAAEKFPESVGLVVGPGFKKNYMPGYPVNAEGVVLESSFT